MKTALTGFLVGLMFAFGLGISGMTLPSKVIGFLDITGDWDYALAFVMGGAVLTYGLLFPLVTRKRRRPVFAASFAIPTRRDLNPSLIAGAALFGVGWGLGGFCPGPALVALTTGMLPVAVFIVAMLAGMFLFGRVEAYLTRDDAKTPPR